MKPWPLSIVERRGKTNCYSKKTLPWSWSMIIKKKSKAPLVPEHDEMMRVLILTPGAQLRGAPEEIRRTQEVQGQGGVPEEDGQG